MTGELSSQIQELRLLMGSPRDPDGRAFAQLGDALRREGRLDEALDVLRDGVGRHPRFTPGHLALAWALQESGAEDQALGAFQEALELDPDNPYALFGAGTLLAAMGREEGAQMVEAAHALDPGIGARAPQTTPGDGDEPPFVPLAELAPDLEEGAEELPFVPLADLAPDPEAADEGLPFVPLADLAPDEPQMAGGRAASPLAQTVPPEPEVPETQDGPAGAEEVEDPRREVEDASPVTRTMAELFARQGLPDRAIRIYERLLEDAPGEAALLERLTELKAQVPAEGPGPIRGTGSPRRPGGQEPEAPEVHPALEVPDPRPLSPSPYGWEADGDERIVTGSATSAGAYFSRLLAWTPGNPAREADEATAPDPTPEPEGEDG